MLNSAHSLFECFSHLDRSIKSFLFPPCVGSGHDSLAPRLSLLLQPASLLLILVTHFCPQDSTFLFLGGVALASRNFLAIDFSLRPSFNLRRPSLPTHRSIQFTSVVYFASTFASAPASNSFDDTTKTIFTKILNSRYNFTAQILIPG